VTGFYVSLVITFVINSVGLLYQFDMLFVCHLRAADFGFARFLQDGVMAATLCGSPMYMVCIALRAYRLDLL